MTPEITPWLCPPVRPLLSHADLHLWRFKCTPDALPADACLKILAADEIRRSVRLLDDTKRKQFIITRASLRLILGRYLQTNPETLLFKYNQHGKPQLAFPQENLFFNLSHSSDYAVLALSQVKKTGVDVEKTDFTINYRGIADQFFTSDERSTLDQVPEARQRRCFYRLWTRKEAVLKAMGTGFKTSSQDSENTKTDWTIRTFPLAGGYVCSCAVAAPVARIIRFDVTGGDLL